MTRHGNLPDPEHYRLINAVQELRHRVELLSFGKHEASVRASSLLSSMAFLVDALAADDPEEIAASLEMLRRAVKETGESYKISGGLS